MVLKGEKAVLNDKKFKSKFHNQDAYFLQALVPQDLRLYSRQANSLLISTSVSDRKLLVTKDLKIYWDLAIKSLISK